VPLAQLLPLKLVLPGRVDQAQLAANPDDDDGKTNKAI
jgi:hypothetical protein